MAKIRLGVNIDHVATVRNARGEDYPSPLRAALFSQKNGADSVTIHLREDRRHINESDLKEIIPKDRRWNYAQRCLHYILGSTQSFFDLYCSYLEWFVRLTHIQQDQSVKASVAKKSLWGR